MDRMSIHRIAWCLDFVSYVAFHREKKNIWGSGCVCYLLGEDRGEVESN